MVALLTYPDNSPAIDVANLVQRRTLYESLRMRMDTDRATWMPAWYQLSAFFLPRDQRFTQDLVNTGYREDFNIINNTPTMALNVLGSGMLTNMTPPTSAWFMLGLQDKAIDERPEVRQWCEDAEEVLRKIFIKSNFYQTLINFYKEQALYGTAAFLIEPDREIDPRKNTIIRCKPYPIGSYMLGCDDQLRIDMSMRAVSMKVRDEVTAFGYDNVSKSTQQLNDSPGGGTKEDWRKVIHTIHKATYFGSQADRITRMPWISCQYELDSFDPENAIISTSGYWENPLIVGRWDVVGENVYGESPAMNVLGDAMSLQSYEDRLAQGAEKLINPPMIASSAIDGRKLSTLPGDITFTDLTDTSKLFMPAYQIDFSKGAEVMLQEIKRIEGRINDGLFRSAFQPLTDLDRREMTAEETRARQQEALQIIGPIVERNVEEALSPAVLRTFGIAFRKHMFRPMPASMHNQPMKIGFESVIAKGQKARELAGINASLALVGQMTAVDPSAQDVVDNDMAIRTVFKLNNVPNNILRTQGATDKIRAAKQHAADQAQNAVNAKNLAGAAVAASNAKTADGSSVLDRLPALGGGSGPQ